MPSTIILKSLERVKFSFELKRKPNEEIWFKEIRLQITSSPYIFKFSKLGVIRNYSISFVKRKYDHQN
jgi:hypothetical protein